MSKENVESFKEILTKNGFRVTKARLDTFNLLISPEPQTISQIVNKAKGTVDRVSIYRNIEVFEKLGLVNRIFMGWKYKLELSDKFLDHHHHLSCLTCGQMIDIKDEKHIDDFIHEIASQFGFTPRNHQFEIDGYCSNCKSK